MKALLWGLLSCIAVTGCKAEGDPRIVWIAFDAYQSSPVVVTSFQVNGVEIVPLPDPVAGLADLPEPRSGGGGQLVDLQPDKSGRGLTVTAEWAELLTQRAWSTQVTVDFDQLQTVNDGAVRAMAVFGPNGLFILTSDPLPISATEFELNDVAKLCARYRPENNHDFAAEADALPGGVEMMAGDYPAVDNPECPQPED